MSDNISTEEIKKRLVLFLSIPAEIWTDVLKTIPRKNLVQQIAPTCYRFNEISNKNIKNVHVIENADQFTKKLEDDDPEANQQLGHLAADQCQLVGQFKLSNVQISEKSQTILRHCPDLFDGCHITLDFEEENKDSTLFLECLDQLEMAKPVVINVQFADQVIDYWHHPTFLNCSRVDLTFWSDLPPETMVNIFDWLHHQPDGVDSDGSAADQQVRCMIVWGIGQDRIGWLINRCSEEIQQGREPINRRPYVLNFIHRASDWPGYDQFRQIENKTTGEVLMLERVMDENGQSYGEYRLRRCLAEEEADGEEFYTGIFKRDEDYDEFRIDEKTPEVFI